MAKLKYNQSDGDDPLLQLGATGSNAEESKDDILKEYLAELLEIDKNIIKNKMHGRTGEKFYFVTYDPGKYREILEKHGFSQNKASPDFGGIKEDVITTDIFGRSTVSFKQGVWVRPSVVKIHKTQTEAGERNMTPKKSTSWCGFVSSCLPCFGHGK